MNPDDLTPNRAYVYIHPPWLGRYSEDPIKVTVLTVVRAPKGLVTVRFESGPDEGTETNIDPRLISHPWGDVVPLRSTPSRIFRPESPREEVTRLRSLLYTALIELEKAGADEAARLLERRMQRPSIL